MKKTTTLLTGFLLLTIVLQAQKKQPRFLTEVAIGPSFPIGMFAEKSFNKDDYNDIPGFAKPGLAAHLSVGYYLNRSVGLLISSGYSVHPQDEEGHKDNIERILPGLTVTELDAKSWKTVKLMAGGFVVTPLTSEGELVLLTKLTAGVSKTAVPQISYYGVARDGTYPSSDNDAKMTLPWSFCYQVSLALEYKLSQNLYVLLDINSFNTTAKKKFVYHVDPNPASPDPQIVTVKNKYKQATVNTMAGIGLRF
jgi:hypothetical protein